MTDKLETLEKETLFSDDSADVPPPDIVAYNELPYYAGQVKCIYIDPPYNTGNEGWVYNDNVSSPVIREWLGKVVGKEGETLDRHDRWLCMMYPRLMLLRKFLREDSVIWISIDDAAVTLLRCLMDEIFGIDKFVACNVWQKRYCPFAYVLCSLKETHSATAIEQIVGRILRLPNAKEKRHPDLNCAYAFSVSDSLPAVLNELREALESNGFTSAEAERIIIPVPQGVLC